MPVERTQPNPARIVELASAYFDSCVLFAASDLGVFAELARRGPSDAATLAAALGLDNRGGRLLLDACVAAGLVTKDGALYGNTADSSAFLVPGQPGDLTGALWYNRDVYHAWGRLKDLARTGTPVESPQLHLGADQGRTRSFVLSMHYRAVGIGRSVASLIELNGARHLLDVGGGPGTYSVLLAQRFPSLRCTVLDLPPVVRIAEELIAEQGMSERVSTLAGDYHETPFPPGLDAINFFGMLHQESPDVIRLLMRRAWDSLNPGGVVHVLDMMTDATHTAPKFSALFAVNMALTTPQGWVFSDAELVGWFEEAGFTNCEVRPLPPPLPHWLARAEKPA